MRDERRGRVLRTGVARSVATIHESEADRVENTTSTRWRWIHDEMHSGAAAHATRGQVAWGYQLAPGAILQPIYARQAESNDSRYDENRRNGTLSPHRLMGNFIVGEPAVPRCTKGPRQKPEVDKHSRTNKQDKFDRTLLAALAAVPAVRSTS